MKNILVLGAGLVSKPLVDHFLDLPDCHVTVATLIVSQAKTLVAGKAGGSAVSLDVTDVSALSALVKDADIVVSFVPYTFHVSIAKICLEHGRSLVTASYVSPEMKALDAEAKKAGLLLLNEVGLDPGIDHMSAMRVIHRAGDSGGRVTSFMSYCGALPAPEAADNPFGYKFSWSPHGVILAGRNGARYLKDGKLVEVEPADLFAHTWKIDISGAGTFEAYPNRDSIPYIEKYGLDGTGTMYRGTLRNPGWCPVWKKFADLGFLDDKPVDLSGVTFRAFTENLAGGPLEGKVPEGPLGGDEKVIHAIKWLGLLDEKEINMEKGSAIDVLEKLLLEKLALGENERDMSLLHHEFTTEYPDRKTMITSTLIHFGTPGGDTSISRTVSLPAAVCAQLILEGKIKVTGVHIPVIPEIYDPVLDELEKHGIAFKEIEHVK